MQVQMDAQCPASVSLSHLSAGASVPVHPTHTCVFMEHLLCAGHCAVGHNTEDIKPVSGGACILVRKTKTRPKKTYKKLCKLLVVIIAKKEKKAGEGRKPLWLELALDERKR